MRPAHGRLAALALACAWLAGCAGTAPPATAPSSTAQDDVADPPAPMPPAATPYEQQQREQALALTRQGKLAEAELIWEVLATIRPNEAEYRERQAELKKRIASGVAERMQRGEQAAARGQIDNAMQQYLSALALDPDNSRAADALRALERERIRRTHLGKLSRHTLTRRAMSEAEVGADAAPLDATALPSGESKSGAVKPSAEVEQATQLAAQGQWDGAIALLERRLRSDRRDAAARSLLADVQFRKADALVLAPANRGTAIALLEQSLRNNPRQPKAAERLQQWRTVAAPAVIAAPATTLTPASAATKAPPTAAARGANAIKPTAVPSPPAPATSAAGGRR